MSEKLIGGLLLVFGLVLIILGAVVLGSKNTFTKDVDVTKFTNTDQQQITNIARASVGVIVIGVLVFIPGFILVLGKKEKGAPVSIPKSSMSGKVTRYYF